MKLARLQQSITLGASLAALIWMLAAWQAGHPWLALAVPPLLVLAYAGVLAAEFVLLHQVHGAHFANANADADATPRATARQLVRAWWGEVLSAPLVFCWQQPFFSQRWPDHLPAKAFLAQSDLRADQAARRGVLLVHGFVCNRGLWNPWLKHLIDQNTPVMAVNLEPIFGSIDDYTGVIERAVQSLERCTGLPPIVVAHSMGGLALRRWWLEPGNLARLHHVITLGTPHHGTWLARFALSPNARQMRQHSPWLAALARRESPELGARLTCFYSHCDNIVFPPSLATVAGADNRHLPGVAHVHMVQSPQPWHELQRQLRLGDAGQGPAT